MTSTMEQITNAAGRYIAGALILVAWAFLALAIALFAVACGLGWLAGWLEIGRAHV